LDQRHIEEHLDLQARWWNCRAKPEMAEPAAHGLSFTGISLQGTTIMSTSRLIAGIALFGLLASPVLAQTAQPNQPSQPARPSAPAQPSQPAAAQPAARTAPAATTQTQGQKVNLNTAADADLEKLPQIGPARAKAILENRTKNGRFKDWNDFVARSVVPSNAEAAIKDLVRF
jgi:competence protein ComEA